MRARSIDRRVAVTPSHGLAGHSSRYSNNTRVRGAGSESV